MDYTKILLPSLILLAIIIITLLVLIALIKWMFKDLAADKLDKYIEFAKWAVASVALVIIAQVIDAGFKDRQAGITEIQQYGNYVDMVVSTDGIGKRWRLAQYFSLVTASKDLRDRWIAYYDVIDKEYKDSTDTLKVYKDTLLQLQKQLKNTNTVDSSKVQQQIKHYEEKMNNLNEDLDTKFGSVSQAINTAVATHSKTDDAEMWEEKGFDYLVSRDIDNAIDAFKKSEKSYPGFHSVYDIYTKVLLPNQAALENKGDDETWKNVYTVIYKSYTWKLDGSIIKRLRELSQ